MKIIRNEKLINRNARISLFISLAAVVLMSIVAYLFYQARNDPALVQSGALFGTMLAALLLVQISFYYGNRFSMRPRPDELLDTALKGMPGEYVIYHHITVVPHLLVGPSGIWVLLPIRQKGKAAFIKGRWRAWGGGFNQTFMRIFGQEGLGRPELEAKYRIGTVEDFLRKKLGDTPVPDISAALVFLNLELELQAEGSPVPAMHLKKLKEFIRKAKENSLNAKEVEHLRGLFEQST